MQYKLDDRDKFSKKEFYDQQQAVDFMQHDVHKNRLMEALRLASELIHKENIKTVADFGAGMGGLLKELQILHPDVKMWGYDLQQTNVNNAVADVQLKDFTKEEVEYPELLIITEVLEHIEDPHKFIKESKAKYIIASSPSFETPTGFHDPSHLWIWTDESFVKLFEGYKVHTSYQKKIGTVNGIEMEFHFVVSEKYE
jgi:hypothetical protein